MFDKSKRGKGYILLWRSIMDRPDYFVEPFDRIRAWVDLLLIGNWEPGFRRINGQRVPYLRGQIVKTKKELGKRWQWHVNTVRRFLKELTIDEDIVTDQNNVTTIITILKYNYYQDPTGKNVSAKNSTGNILPKGKRSVGHIKPSKSSPVGTLKNKKGVLVTVKGSSDAIAENHKKHTKSAKSGRAKKQNNDSKTVGHSKTAKSAPVRVSEKNIRVGDTVKGRADLRVHGITEGRTEGRTHALHLKEHNTFKEVKEYRDVAKKSKKQVGGRKNVAPGAAARSKTEQTMLQLWKTAVPDYTSSKKFDTKACTGLKQFLAEQKGYNPADPKKQSLLIDDWKALIPVILKNKFYADKPLKTIANNIQNFYKKYNNATATNQTDSTGAAGETSASQSRFDRIRAFGAQ